MRKSATVIGSGITGPMAALTLQDNGYDVTVYDARPATDLYSDGILGITDSVWGIAELYGIALDQWELKANSYTNAFGETTRSPFHYITWTDLHHAITERAEKAGVQFQYGQKVYDTPNADVVVWATGVGSAREVSTPDYTGYVILRGFTSNYAGTAWEMAEGFGPEGRWVFAVGDTRDGASLTMFIPRNAPQMRTTYSAVAPAEILSLSPKWQTLARSVTIWQTAPMSDWTVPDRLHTRTGDGQHVFRLGDANGQMRPQTSMGANLALDEASNLAALLDPSPARGEAVERNLLRHRSQQYRIGILAGV